MQFSDLGISKPICSSLYKNNIRKATKIQEETIPEILDGKNIIANAKTGSGKTLAFLTPIIQLVIERKEKKLANEIGNLKDSKKNVSPFAIILAPTRELAMQIDESISLLDSCLDIEINTLAVYGGKDVNAQINKLKKGVDIVTATPGRLFDHINRKSLTLDETEILVVDEVDNMLLMGFRKDVDEIVKMAKKDIQILLFSATVDRQTKKMAYSYKNDFIEISTSEAEEKPDIKQRFVKTTDRRKYDDLFEILDSENPFMAIIFTRTKARADKLEEKMKQKKYNCEKIHSDISQNKRERILRDFKDLKIQYLIATDVASRGLDIQGITHIFNFDFPENKDDYTHRIGRTARMNKDGESVSFVTDKDENVYMEVLREYNLD